MSDTKTLIPKQTGILQNIKDILKGIYKQIIDSLQGTYQVPAFLIIISIFFIFLGPCLISYRENFTNELEQVTQEPLESEEQILLISEPTIYSEKTYENTSLDHTPPGDFEVLKNFDILETNNIVSVKEKINDYSNQPTFSPGQFN